MNANGEVSDHTNRHARLNSGGLRSGSLIISNPLHPCMEEDSIGMRISPRSDARGR